MGVNEMKRFILAILLVVLLSTTANAITGTSLTGMVQVNVDETPATYEKSIGMRNDNNFSVEVFFKVEGDVEGMIEFEENNFVLSPNEEKFVKFKISVEDKEVYRGNINTFFVEEGSLINETTEKIGVTTKVLVVPKVTLPGEEVEPEPEPEANYGWVWYAGAGLVILIAILIYFLIVRGGKK